MCDKMSAVASQVDEIFGTLRDYYISVKLNDDVKASSFSPKQKVGCLC